MVKKAATLSKKKISYHLSIDFISTLSNVKEIVQGMYIKQAMVHTLYFHGTALTTV